MPPVAPISTGFPARASSSVTLSASKNDLNSPLYEAENTGVTTIRPAGRRHRVEGGGEIPAREPAGEGVR